MNAPSPTDDDTEQPNASHRPRQGSLDAETRHHDLLGEMAETPVQSFNVVIEMAEDHLALRLPFADMKRAIDHKISREKSNSDKGKEASDGTGKEATDKGKDATDIPGAASSEIRDPLIKVSGSAIDGPDDSIL